MSKRLFIGLIVGFLCCQVFAQETPVVMDTVDRNAEDFVRASLLVVDPSTKLYSILGHACLRMQCPTYDLDYCFSYEHESVQGKVFRFLIGDLKMGMMAVPTDEFVSSYAQECRGIWEYPLNLPIDAKRNLWRILDNRLMEGTNLAYDPIARGCAITCLHCVEEALGTLSITYAPWPENYRHNTLREICYEFATDSWSRFLLMTICGSPCDKANLFPKEKLVVPTDLASVWQQATIEGKPLLQEPVLMQPYIQKQKKPFITPFVVAVCFFVVCFVFLFLRSKIIDTIGLVLYALIAGSILFFALSPSTVAGWSWLLIPFNPLPLMAWNWRRYWDIPYVGAVICWIIAMLLAPHQYVETAHIILALSFALFFVKRNFETYFHNTKHIT